MDCSYRRILIGLIISALVFMLLVAQCDNIHEIRSCPWMLPSFKRLSKSKYGLKSKNLASRHTVTVAEGLPITDVTNTASKETHIKQDETPRKRLPDAIIIGAKKAGTRALIRFLRLHPNISAAGPEIHFFNRNFEKGYDWYIDQMPISKSYQIVMEKTPKYLVTKSAPKNIYKMNPNIKLIVILRDPVRRALSDYTQGYSKHRKNRDGNIKTFRQQVLAKDGLTVKAEKSELIRVGLYAKHLKRWLDVFKRDQLLIISAEGLVKNPAKELLKVQNFLGLSIYINKNSFVYSTNKTFYCIKDRITGKPLCLNEMKGRKHVETEPEVLDILYDFYKPYNEKLYKLIGMDFNWQNH